MGMTFLSQSFRGSADVGAYSWTEPPVGSWLILNSTNSAGLTGAT
jgi:hypothetical protein